MQGFRVLHVNTVAGNGFISTLRTSSPGTTLGYNTLLVELLKVVDALSAPATYYKRDASARIYAGYSYKAEGAAAASEIPIVGLSSSPGDLPDYWTHTPITTGAAAIDSDRRMWGLALLLIVYRYGKAWRLLKSASAGAGSEGQTAGAGVVYSSAAVEAGGLVAVPRELAWAFAPDRTTDKSTTAGVKEVVFAAPFDPACHGGLAVYAGAVAFEARLSAFLRAGSVIAPLGAENDTAARAEAMELAGQMQALLKRGDRTAVGLFVASTAALVAGWIGGVVTGYTGRRAIRRRARALGY